MTGLRPQADEAMPRAKVGAIVVAAGASRRMGGADKVFAVVAGRPLIAHSVQALQDAPEVDAIVLVLAIQSMEQGRRLAAQSEWSKVVAICEGGQRRQDSVRSGLALLRDTHWVIVHDGARPCLDPEMIGRGLARARETGAAVAAVPAKDTIKLVSPNMVVTETLLRDQLWAVQTPQVFRTTLLLEAHEKIGDEVTDDASMVERMGRQVAVFMGSYENIKVTTPEDLVVAEAFLVHRRSPRRRPDS